MKKSLCLNPSSFRGLSMAASLSFTRRFSSQSPFQKALQRHLLKLGKSLYPNIIKLENPFSVPVNRDPNRPCFYPHSGVFVDPTTIVTSAHLIGRVAAVGMYRSRIATTVAIAPPDCRLLKTEPLAVSFAHDVAVLKLVAPPDAQEIVTSFRPCSIAKPPPNKDDILLAIQELDCYQCQLPGNVRAVGGRTFNGKAPWPLDNDSGRWMEFDFLTYGHCGSLHRPSYSFNSEEEITGFMSPFSGSPVFNMDGELIGVTSWEVTYSDPRFLAHFAASLSQIRAAIEYAKTKKPDDPIVMDTWISDCDGL